MRNTIKRILAVMTVLALICGAVSFAAAENYGFIPKGGTARLTVHEDSKAGMAVGGKIKLTMARPDGTQLEAASFHSSKKSVATVSENGTVKAKQAGKVKITMTAASGERYTLTLTVADPAAPDKISFSRRTLETFTGMTADLGGLLEAKPYTEAVDPAKLFWGSSNVRVATVDRAGILTAQSPGKATVTVKTKNGKSASIAVTVGVNKVDYLQPAPLMSDIDFGEQIYLKSIEITHPGVVTCEYWLLFKHYPTVHSTYFSWVEDQIIVDGKKLFTEIVNGSMPNIKCRTAGQTIKLFKVVYRGDAVKNTDVRLSKYRDQITWNSRFWLNWKY